MHAPPFGRTRAGRPGARLLVALALCACGGADGGAGGAEKEGTEARAMTSQAGAPAKDCQQPPPVATAEQLSGPWQALLDALKAQGASIPLDSANTDTATVPLCDKTCPAVRLSIHSNVGTCGIQPETLTRGQNVFMGVFLLDGDFPGDTASGWPPLQEGDTLALFVNDTTLTIVYDNEGKATAAPHTWNFFYCQDGETGKFPRARWRPRLLPLGGPHDKGKDGDDGDGGSYGWMACASGCCQFYTPPPNPIVELPDQANPRARDTVGPGRNQGNARLGVRPTWCLPR
ncbi:MAG TPA: hypothetical protein VHG93_18990 [Longimicrobium sp.]|nr:hypothetical protein [Longimicrobium sp.]